MEDPNQVAEKLAYIMRERERQYATKKEAAEAVEDMVLEFEDEDRVFLHKMKLGIQQGEFTLDDLAAAFKDMMKFVLERADGEDDEELYVK
jgi:hypothetical protein